MFNNIKCWIVPTNENQIRRNSAFWNMTSSLLNAVQTALLLLVITRVCGSVIGGIFSISATIAYQANTIGNYSMRNFQATDVKEEYSFGIYVGSRFVTLIFMPVFLAVYILLKGYAIEKTLIVLTFALFKSIDVIEDVIHGNFHQKGRLDFGGITETIRYFTSILLFIILIVVTKNLLVTNIIVTIASFTLFLILNIPLIKKFGGFQCEFNLKRIFCLLKVSFPLFICGFVYMYICNMPKYSIDSYMSEESQAVFGVIFMPVFVINLLSCFVYRPLLSYMAYDWKDGNFKSFFKVIKRQVLLILIITFAAMVAGYFLGAPILGVVYGINLNGYESAIALLLLGGGISALIGFAASIVTIIRKQIVLYVGYFTSAIVGLTISRPMVSNYGIYGAGILYDILMFVLLFALIIAILIVVKLQKNKKIEE